MYAPILFLIDLQNGFLNPHLGTEEGGNLYVPAGETVIAPSIPLLQGLSNGVFILSQDFHPRRHISFASTHSGARPFDQISLYRSTGGQYKIGTGPNAFQQTLWPEHCTQGSYSALLADHLLAVLPSDLRFRLEHHDAAAYLVDIDDRNNTYYVIRKGTTNDLDSYGIATENDGTTTTLAPQILTTLVQKLYANGIRTVDIAIGGLATNYCVEFSHKDLYKYLVPQLRELAIDTKVFILTDLCAHIPVSTPDGTWPDWRTALDRMRSFGTHPITSQAFLDQAKRKSRLCCKGNGSTVATVG